MSKKFLVIGSGGREAAMLWKLAQENPGAELYCAPGNAGISHSQRVTCVNINVTDIPALVQFASINKIDLTICGPEVPLIGGAADQFAAAKLLFCGPSSTAAYNSEGSKANFKRILEKYHIPTAPFKVFDDWRKGLDYVKALGAENIVIKADGLAAGKGVDLPDDEVAAEITLKEMMVDKKLGSAADVVVIENRLYGYECSAMGVTDGWRVHLFPYTQDHKRALDGDKGKNTGGMGAYTMALSPGIQNKIESTVKRILDALAQEGCFYKGFIYVGFIITKDGPMVLECNCRLGDPETQAILPVINGFTNLCMGAAEGNLLGIPPPAQTGESLCIVLSSLEYPEPSARDVPIAGLKMAESLGALVFHAGTGWKEDTYTTNRSGRILNVVGRGQTLAAAHNIAYQAAGAIITKGALRFRSDIGALALENT